MGPEASPGSGSAGRRPKGSLTRQGSSSGRDRKSTRLNSSHSQISYAVFCLKKKKIPVHMYISEKSAGRFHQALESRGHPLGSGFVMPSADASSRSSASVHLDPFSKLLHAP